MFSGVIVRLLPVWTCLAVAFAALQDGTQSAKGHWVETWVSMPQLAEPANLPPAPFNGSETVFLNTTIRQTIKTTIGGSSYVRLRISNAFGLTELPITAGSIALSQARAGQNRTGASGIDVSTLHSVKFSGLDAITIPPGALAISDAVPMTLDASQIVSINLYLASGQQGFAITSHPGSRTTSWLSFGNQVAASNLTDSSVARIDHWYLISALEAWVPRSSRSLVIVGDSLTDGRGSTTNGNDRWPDQLFYRLQTSSNSVGNLAILNQAAGGNRILADGLCPATLSRVERDILAHPNVGYAMIFEGVNDIGSAASTYEAQDHIYNRLVQAYKQIVTRIHANGIPVLGATITPFGCENSTLQAYSTPEREATRARINAFIRNYVGVPGGFDALVDFDQIARDPGNEMKLREEFDSGDCLHLNPEGYKAIADSFPVAVFEQFAEGVDGLV